ncbi:peptidase domain-containing ABC transporter [Fulvimarina endophytica]|uniref:Peptidase domain-containing ABC transporter n=1 Tax=Fulvimarina endophytica TaxID=2293836 RepID=A0A371WYU8_9HYPH|nr:peptidase domain-containing ABC transporter [Fulvimarina endophytica]RFC62165.1 peptidase domain-containing ABC transporter [Fulvimarina endophytica]
MSSVLKVVDQAKPAETEGPSGDGQKGQGHFGGTSGHHTALHALSMAARQRGVHMSVEQLVRDYRIGEAEAPNELLMTIAKDHGLEAREVRLKWAQLARLKDALPALLRLETGATLVIVSFEQRGGQDVAIVRDPTAPSSQPVAIDEIRMAAVWTGSAILLKRHPAGTMETQTFGWGMLIREFVLERKIFGSVALSALVLALFALVPPLLFMVIVNNVMLYQRMSTLVVLATVVVFYLIFDTAFGYLRRYLIAVGTAKIDARLNVFIMNRILRLPIELFERMPVGDLSYRITQVFRIRNFITGSLFNTLLDSFVLIFLLPALFLISARMAFAVVGVALVMCLIVAAYIPAMGKAYGRVIRAETRKNTTLIESIHGMRTIKSLALEGRKRQEWDEHVAEAVKANTDFQLLGNQPQTMLNPLEKLVYSGSLLLGAALVLTGTEPFLAGTLIFFVMVVGRAVAPFIQIANLLQEYQEVKGAVDMVGSIVNEAPERPDGMVGSRPVIKGRVTFSDVRFRYPGATSFALNGVDFEAKQGSVVGIMGRSGSGKTTVTRLLQGLNMTYEGLIKIDGVDLKEIDLYHLRSNLGVVLQDNFLFQGTIRENIMAAKPDATLEEVTEAARMAGAEEFIERLSRGYDTFIAEGSANLSGGQKQRIAIARALILNPAVLILDEATSALDPDSEAIVNSNLRKIAKGRTVIVISHRLSSLTDCDQILVMERGRVVDTGRHGDLLNESEIYRQLWFQQNRHLGGTSQNETDQSQDA